MKRGHEKQAGGKSARHLVLASRRAEGGDEDRRSSRQRTRGPDSLLLNRKTMAFSLSGSLQTELPSLTPLFIDEKWPKI